ncbi:Tripartite tricarboxylate transporter family receptor [Pigmentiphaga humi]|uniref:Tripartite tricarboxylate transporter family receptor n=1 Tax=Pigmentiphaga humi TaxID=2478468 RepID=A0A3P4AZ79_9BURK|nr:tripartite tricarboxylate transporter substrate-binding protein [Pigmentiphaga humi]VCU68871.1 Tripartite tricarboxylate transporter family receptor [Pigmentiphaga humi]
MTMTTDRRSFLAMLAAAALPPAAHAQDLQRQLRILVGFPPGGTPDLVARLYAEAMRPDTGAPIIVENRSGASGQIAAEVVSQQPPDGGTLLMANNHMMSTAPLTMRSIKYDPLKDFEPVSMVAAFEVVLIVGGKLGAKTFRDYVETVRRQPQNAATASPRRAACRNSSASRSAAKRTSPRWPSPIRAQAASSRTSWATTCRPRW